MSDRKPVTAPDLIEKKARGERIVVVTAYDYPTALYADQAGVDAILVGDTLGMVVLGYPTTLPVTMEEMLHHVRAVGRAQPKALVIADMPFLSYQVSADEAVRNAGRLLKEGGAAAVKLEGGAAVAPVVARLVAAGIPVMGHLGMTPQSVHELGGFRVQARHPEAARQLLQDARELEAAGAFGIVLELVPAEVAQAVTEALRIPTIGIGAGARCDGEVQVFHDLLGLFEWFVPRHTKRYAEIGKTIRDALAQYAEEVRSGAFPAEENTFHQPDLEDGDTWKS
jgi:3-methyl-2-oxobutanoate hydroxymethyltransferase